MVISINIVKALIVIEAVAGVLVIQIVLGMIFYIINLKGLISKGSCKTRSPVIPGLRYFEFHGGFKPDFWVYSCRSPQAFTVTYIKFKLLNMIFKLLKKFNS